MLQQTRPTALCPVKTNQQTGRSRLRQRYRAAAPRRKATERPQAMGIKAVEAVDASFTLPKESAASLNKLLASAAFCQQASVA